MAGSLVKPANLFFSRSAQCTLSLPRRAFQEPREKGTGGRASFSISRFINDGRRADDLRGLDAIDPL